MWVAFLLANRINQLLCPLYQIPHILLLENGIVFGVDPVHIVAEELFVIQGSYRNCLGKSCLVGGVVDFFLSFPA